MSKPTLKQYFLTFSPVLNTFDYVEQLIGTGEDYVDGYYLHDNPWFYYNQTEISASTEVTIKFYRGMFLIETDKTATVTMTNVDSYRASSLVSTYGNSFITFPYRGKICLMGSTVSFDDNFPAQSIKITSTSPIKSIIGVCF